MTKRKRAARSSRQAVAIELALSSVEASSRSDEDDAATGAENDTLIKDLIAMPISDFQDRYIDSNLLSYRQDKVAVQLDLQSATQLASNDLDSCFNLIETTSRADYEPSSFGWHPTRKRREMREPEMRYLLVRSGHAVDTHAVMGFISFMMTHDSSPSVPVLYIYEIHLEARLRKVGLGAHLMHLVESIAAKAGVAKVMLTCFLGNEKALAFYRKRGYETDACSPEDRTTRKKVVKTDYLIMSKTVASIMTQSTAAGHARIDNGMLSAVRGLTAELAGKQMKKGEDVAHIRGWV